jgi:phage terminase large subunit-like protein
MTVATSIGVEFLFHMHATLADPIVIPNGPAGTRVIVGITGGTVKGPKVNGTVAHLGADWLTLRADGTAQLDVRALISTDDGASIHAHYLGIMSPGADGSPRIVTAPLFEASDERYRWLNGLQAVAVGSPGAGSVDYDAYRIL